MRILIDMQGCQSSSRRRGIGRYSMSLAKAMVRNAGDHEIWLLINGLLQDSVADIKGAFKDMIPDERMFVFHVPGPVSELDDRHLSNAREAELIRETVINLIEPDVVHLTSLFEGFVDDTVTSVRRLSWGPPVAVTLYDLIPWVNADHYFQNLSYKASYLRKIESLKKADLLLAISNSSAEEAYRELAFPASKIALIGSAINPEFRILPNLVRDVNPLLERLGITKPFIFYVGNVEPHKNISGLIESFALLPESTQNAYELAVLVNKDAHHKLKTQAEKCGIRQGKLVLLDGVDDSHLIELYNLCHVFVLPSLHEGFGLPALEAMACGAPVIGSNTTSIPEVIGRSDALFNPRDASDIARVLQRVLTEPAFVQALKSHAALQAKRFSWDITAKKALAALEAVVAEKESTQPQMPYSRPKLAMVTPMPPEQTGIADYSVELLRALAVHYDMTLVTPQAQVHFPLELLAGGVQSPLWFDENANKFDRIVYQVGNSPFHAHMFALNERHPGVVDLHDFFVSAVFGWMQRTGYSPNAYECALWGHGYNAILMDAVEGQIASMHAYPANRALLNSACGVIVHSAYPRELARHFYGKNAARDWEVIPHARMLPATVDRSGSRARLGLEENDFLVCAFGFVDFTKLNHVLADAWKAARLGNSSKRFHLVFVGQNAPGEYGEELLRKLALFDDGTQARITGFASHELYNRYLAAADAAVQLRTMSRGETSGTVLDCLAHGIPLVIAANGGMAEYPNDILIKIRDGFSTEELVNALHAICNDDVLRRNLSLNGPEYISKVHRPAAVAARYRDAIEKFAAVRKHRTFRKIIEAAELKSIFTDAVSGQALRDEIDSLHSPVFNRKLYYDISALVKTDLKTGIERVVRGLLNALLVAPPPGFDVEPVYFSNTEGGWRYRLARNYMAQKLGIAHHQGGDARVIPRKGDIFFGADLFPEGVETAAAQGLYNFWRACGASLHFMVYDLLPISLPEFFPPGADKGHRRWLETVCAQADGVICISKAVSNDVREWLAVSKVPARAGLEVSHIHLGADIDASLPSRGLPEEAAAFLEALRASPTFLMVGTVEPRKGYLQALSAFEQLWAANSDVKLVIVGHEGWKAVPHELRRTVPQIVEKLRGHKELGKRLFWLEGISDEYLEAVYTSSTCLLFASEGEGFGLPLIEAARRNLPVLARDLPVFREVAGCHATYFSGMAPEVLAGTVISWIESNGVGQVPVSAGMRWHSWAECATELANLLTHEHSLTQ